MAIYRQIQTNFWQDGFVSDLTPGEKYFYFYLMTNPRTTQCGIFELNKRIVEAETGYNRETIEKLIKRFEGYGKILYCKETKEIIILNWVKYNFINSKNTICCINKELKLVKNKEFVKLLYKNCLMKGYDVEAIFKDVPLAVMEDKLEVIPEEIKVEIEGNKTEDNKLGVQAVVLDSAVEEVHSNFINDDTKKQRLIGGFEGAYKDLGEKEKQKEKQKEAYNKQKVINKTKGAADDFKEKKFSCKLLMEFNKNIRQATIRDMGYIEAVLKSWKSACITTMDELSRYREGCGKKSTGVILMPIGT